MDHPPTTCNDPKNHDNPGFKIEIFEGSSVDSEVEGSEINETVKSTDMIDYKVFIDNVTEKVKTQCGKHSPISMSRTLKTSQNMLKYVLLKCTNLKKYSEKTEKCYFCENEVDVKHTFLAGRKDLVKNQGVQRSYLE